MSRSQKGPWTDDERISLLVEILNVAGVDCVSLLARAVIQNNREPRWEDVPLPEGRSLRSCRAEYGDILSRYNGQQPHIPSAGHATYQPIHSLPPTSAKRSFQESEMSYPPIQPRPSLSSASPIVSATNVGLAVPRSSPLSTLPESGKRKQGRPSKAEIARRQAEAAAQGKEYVPQVRRRPKKPQALAGSPLPPPVVTSESTRDSPLTAQTPPRQPVEPPHSGSSGRRKRQRLDEQQQQSLQQTQGTNVESAESSAAATARAHITQSPSDRVRPDAKFAARGTAHPSTTRTNGSTSSDEGSDRHDSEAKEGDPSSTTGHAKVSERLTI